MAEFQYASSVEFGLKPGNLNKNARNYLRKARVAKRKSRRSKTGPGGRKKPITAKQRAARKRNIAIARRYRSRAGSMRYDW